MDDAKSSAELKKLSLESAWLAAIVESAEDAIISKTLDGIITSWNRGAEQIFGYTADEVVGKPILILIPPDHHDEEPQILQSIRQGKRIEHYETIRQGKDGSLIDISLTVSPIKDTDGKIIGVSKIARDISYQKTVENRLIEADRRKDEFLATLAHELRNPLAPIRSGLEIIRRVIDDHAKLNETLDIIERQTNQIIHLVDDLLDISRITQGKIKLRIERIELKTAIEIALETSQGLIDESQNELTVTLPYKPIYIEGDLTRVVQIFLNILNNAAKYSDPGGKISLVVSKEDTQAVIRIKDTGLGIAREMQPKIFEMFGQIQTVNEQARGGLGIGLSVVKKLVKMHGGGVKVFSEGLGKGSEFIIRLPLAAEQSKTLPADKISETDILQTAQMKMPDDLENSKKQSKARQFSILVVDDNPDAAEMLETLLSIDGHTVRKAFEAKTGIEIAEEFQPEVCLCDIGLPGMNGYELAAHLRSLLPDTLLISISGWGQEEDHRRSIEAGFNYHLVKPVKLDDLLKLIQKKIAEKL
jgi:PAS domain S-box-containing protein